MLVTLKVIEGHASDIEGVGARVVLMVIHQLNMMKVNITSTQGVAEVRPLQV
jgi:hypothetical protein